MKQADVPSCLQHLPFVKGYPVPYVVAWFLTTDPTKPASGKIDPAIHQPNFNLSDERKWYICAKHKKCWVCGKELGKAAPCIITGPKGLETCTQSDLLMHEECARASMQVCPYIFYQKVEREEFNPVMAGKLGNSAHQDQQKPASQVLIKVGTYRYIRIPSGGRMINFEPIAVQWHDYANNRLTPRSDAMEAYKPRSWKQAGQVFDPQKLIY